MTNSFRFEAFVIGTGHSGLTTAATLFQAGLKTAVLERQGIGGGCAVTEEIDHELAPGYRVSAASYIASMLQISNGHSVSRKAT